MGVLLESADSSGQQRSRRGAALIEAVLGSVKKRKQGKKTATGRWTWRSGSWRSLQRKKKATTTWTTPGSSSAWLDRPWRQRRQGGALGRLPPN